MSGRLSLEPLADYVRPRFGNVYDDYGLPVRQVWTDELQAAVRHYLVDVADDPLYQRALERLVANGYVPPAAPDRVQEAEAILAQEQPWEVAYAFHEAAVILQPTLDGLITHRSTWDEDERLDAVVWLEAHSTLGQLADIVEWVQGSRPEFGNDGRTDLLIVGVTEEMAPGGLVRLWNDFGPAPSDLTMAEWQLVAPFLPWRSDWSDNELAVVHRRHLNGFLYHYATGVPWSQVPVRYYGRGRRYRNLTDTYYRWRKERVFVRMLEALQDDSGAARLVPWLKTVAA